MSRIFSDDKHGQLMKLGLFTLVGLISLVVGIVLLSGRSAEKKRCTEPVPAVVVDFEKRHSEHRIKYAPVFEYEYGGKKYTRVSRVASKKPDYSRGDKTTLMIDPNDPTVVYMQDDAMKNIITICLVFGIIFSTFGGIGIKITLTNPKL